MSTYATLYHQLKVLKIDRSEKNVVNMFDRYLAETADEEDRVQCADSYGYYECEWKAFQFAWEAALAELKKE